MQVLDVPNVLVTRKQENAPERNGLWDMAAWSKCVEVTVAD